ncbi:MAG: hypothetical protein KC657_16395 [Myxococcales bacterium]|nr:hypothetical protein [Myxococcales bacterium]
MKGRLRALTTAAGCVIATFGASCTQTASIEDVYTSLDANGARRRQEFFTDTAEINCIIEAVIGRPGATLEVQLRQIQRYDPAQRGFTNADRVLGYAEFSPQPSKDKLVQAIKLSKRKDTGEESEEAPYLAGRYQCEVFLDGEGRAPAEFNVRFPPCPSAQIVARSQCLGFYEDGRQCPAFGASSREPDTCTCQGLTGWSCQ